MSETVLKPLRTFCCEQKLILFYNAHADNTRDRTKGIDNLLAGRRLHIHHGICHVSFGLIGHIGNIDAVITEKRGEFRYHIRHIQVEYCDSSRLITDSHITGRIIHTVIDISVFQEILQLLNRH